MSFKLTCYAFLGNLYFWLIDPLIMLYIKIKVRARRVYRKFKDAIYEKVPDHEE